jgi:HD-GYP domain-containing protein (c-di-GMP phosphodiesterase class II)
MRPSGRFGFLVDVLLGLTVLFLVVGRPPAAAVTGPLVVAALLLRLARSRAVEQHNRRLLEDERRFARAGLEALSAAVEARDGYTGRHGEETVTLARAVAAHLGLAGAEFAEVESVALLHDVGKLGIPDAILHKPGPLTPDEWEVMRTHTEIGERILLRVPGLERIARAVRHEHERWDGLGYPDRIAGRAIPLASRVTLVCDAFHAMTSDRAYRSAMPAGEALAELRRCAGSQFDPAVVAALLAVVDA